MGLSVKVKKKIKGFSLDVAWEIGDELAVLFGHSGSGKSMTLQMITGLLRPDEGLISSNSKTYFDSAAGIDVPPQARGFGYVCQDLALFPHQTVIGNILFGGPAVPKKERLARAREMIREFKLEGLENRYPSEISGGQKQRVAFARALIGCTDVLLLDEAFSALDAPLRAEMRYFLIEIKKQFAIPVIVVTHDPDEAAILAEKIVLYSHGNVVQAAPPENVIFSPAGSKIRMPLNLPVAQN